jgi:peptidoglycan hydrolase-like protein with peptidoglycan-binding domain
VQQLLISRGFATNDPPGNIGQATTSAAVVFQASDDLPVDGRITADLLIALERDQPAARATAERSARP